MSRSIGTVIRMNYGGAPEAQMTLRAYVDVLLRHRGIVLLSALVVFIMVVALSLVQKPLYQASAEVLVSRQSLASVLTGTADPNETNDFERILETQARVARAPEVVRRTVEAIGVDMSRRKFLQRSQVAAQPDADLIQFTFEASDRSTATSAATAYAEQFTAYRRELDEAAVARASARLEARIAELKLSGETESALYRDLIDKRRELSILNALQTSNAFVLGPIETPIKLQPRLARNAVVALVLGTVLGAALAFAREAISTGKQPFRAEEPRVEEVADRV